jgi:hypothetical protein
MALGSFQILVNLLRDSTDANPENLASNTAIRERSGRLSFKKLPVVLITHRAAVDTED